MVVPAGAFFDSPQMAPAPYLIVFDFMEEAPPSVWPLLGMLLVGAVGCVMLFWGSHVLGRIFGGALAVLAISVGTSDILNSRAEYNRVRSDLAADRVRSVEGVLRVTGHGQFTIGAETFSLPMRPGARDVYAFNPTEVIRFEGMCAQGRFASEGLLTSLGVRRPVGGECSSGEAARR